MANVSNLEPVSHLAELTFSCATPETETLAQLRALHANIAGISFRFSTDPRFPAEIEEALLLGEYAAEQEHALDEYNRVDFMLPAGIAILVKLNGSRAEVLRQVGRYAQFPQVAAILLITTQPEHWLPDVLNGKPMAAHTICSASVARCS